MITVRTKAELREALAGHGDSSVGLVPTMGALHEAHPRLEPMYRALAVLTSPERLEGSS